MFNGGEFIQLKADYPNYGLQAGDCGVIWGIYDIQVFDLLPMVYEATFHNETNGGRDMMFNAEEVELIVDIASTRCPAWLLETWRIFEVFEQQLRQEAANS